MRPVPRALTIVAVLTVFAAPPLVGAAAAEQTGPPETARNGEAGGGATAVGDQGTQGRDGSGYPTRRPRLVWGNAVPNTEGTRAAYTYDAELVPAGASVSLLSVSLGNRTRTMLAVRGLRPHRTYGIHLHVNPCGADPAAAGPHYQHRVGPTDDPDYANPENEVWLDVRTNARGGGGDIAQNPWRYRAAPGSVVLHEHGTSTDPDSPGVAGDRAACVTLASR